MCVSPVVSLTVKSWTTPLWVSKHWLSLVMALEEQAWKRHGLGLQKIILGCAVIFPGRFLSLRGRAGWARIEWNLQNHVPCGEDSSSRREAAQCNGTAKEERGVVSEEREERQARKMSLPQAQKSVRRVNGRRQLRLSARKNSCINPRWQTKYRNSLGPNGKKWEELHKSYQKRR